MKRKLLSECLGIAIKNNHKHPEGDCYHHFSFVIQNNKIVEWGTNRRASAIKELGFKSYSKLHSEVDAFRKAKGIIEKNENFEVINIRLNKDNLIKGSKPCKCCYAFLKHLGCQRVWFTTNIGSFAAIIPE